MSAYAKALLLLHIGGAIIGLGPTFAYSVLGPMSGKVPPPGGLAIMEAMISIERRLVIPIAMVILPASGALLIWEQGYNHIFWQQDWLFTSVVLYAVAIGLAVGVQNPALHGMITLAKDGKGGTPEFMKLVKRSAALGPILTLLTVALIFLMVWKPGR